MTGYMLDTNLFNGLVDGKVSLNEFQGKKLMVTHVQHDELNATSERTRRENLLSMFETVSAASVATSTAIWDDSRWDGANWSDDDKLYEKMLAELKKLDKAAGKRPKAINQSRDVRIAETAIKNNLTLVTDDENLRTVTAKFNGNAICCRQLETLS
jgi:predicted nucleic acid-binding protein